MIWLTWRQFRAQALVTLAGTAALAVYLLLLGRQIRDAVDDCAAGCAQSTVKDEFFNPLLLTGFLVVLLPALIGAFWGAPLVARELEAGTHRLAWNQSVTRRRWLAVKLGMVGLSGVALTGLLSALLTWAASPYDALAGGRFDPVIFPTRNIAPLGYALFAVVAGTTIGLLTRRTVAAMAITLAVFAALQVVLPTVVRPHLRPALTETVPYDANAPVSGARINSKGGTPKIEGYALPGAWVMSASTELLDAANQPVPEERLIPCFSSDHARDGTCLAAQNLHFVVKYQPADRYWLFQWLELAVYVLLAGALGAFAFWRIPRGFS